MATFPSPLLEAWVFFLWSSPWELRGLLEVKLTKVPSTTTSQDWGSLGVFNSQACPQWVSRNLSITVEIFLPWYWFQLTFLRLRFCFGKPWFSASSCVSLQFGGPYDLKVLLDLKDLIFCCCCSAFSLAVKIEGMTSKFLICHIRNWKSELLFLIASFWLL